MAKYRVITDKDGFISEIYQSKDGIEINISSIDLPYLSCYKIAGDKLVMDEAKKESLIADEIRQNRISELRMLLTESDDIMGGFLDEMASLNNPVTFISDFVKLIGNINTKYAQLIVDRKAWREELEELLK